MNCLVVRLSAMGDVIHSLPLASNLARAGHRVSWLIEDRFARLLVGNPHIARVHIAATKRWRRHPWSAVTRREVGALAQELRAERYDSVLDPMGNWKSCWAGSLPRSRTFVLDDRSIRFELCRWFAHVRVTPRPDAIHVVDKNLALLDAIGVSVADPRPDASYLPTGATAASTKFLARRRRPFALYHPGAGRQKKSWGLDRFADAARRIERDLDLTPVVSWGPGDETLAGALARDLHAPMPPLFDFPDLAALIARCSLFVGGDTGPLHLADALGIPTVALFGPTDPRRSGPYRFREGTLWPSSPSSASRSFDRGMRDLARIPAESVAARAAEVLRKIGLGDAHPSSSAAPSLSSASARSFGS
jgi:heptosyltransferase I